MTVWEAVHRLMLIRFCNELGIADPNNFELKLWCGSCEPIDHMGQPLGGGRE